MELQACDIPYLERILHVMAPRVTVRNARFLDEGWDNRLFLVNDELVVRIAKTEDNSRQLLTEARTLQVLAPLLPLPIPRLEFVHQPSQDFPWSVVGYHILPGDSLLSEQAGRDVVDALAPDLARFLASLHATPLDLARESGVQVWTPEEWLARHDDLVRNALDELRRMLDRQTLTRFLRWWEDYRRDPAARSFTACLIHGDLACEHVLVERNPWRVTGIIDFGDAMVADPALDLAGFPDELARAVMGLSSHITDRRVVWKRRDAYRRLSPLHAVLKGRDRGDMDLIRGGIERLKVLLSA